MGPYPGDRRARHPHRPRGAPAAGGRRTWDVEPYWIDRRPSFGLWLRITWPDIVTTVLVGGVALGVSPRDMTVYLHDTFPLAVADTHTGEDTSEVVYPQFAYAYRPRIIAPWVDALLAAAFQGFPSGHPATITAAAVCLSLYLNAKLKVLADHHAPMRKLVLLYCPTPGAVLVCGSLTVDASHNWCGPRQHLGLAHQPRAPEPPVSLHAAPRGAPRFRSGVDEVRRLGIRKRRKSCVQALSSGRTTKLATCAHALRGTLRITT
ncbi:hypothetical protein GGS23DRAFT_620023 [Durotheca rogersii]|uniref:uncharacterized protein n=1 Tax=Durotheca rogersii TaxID=419775 RepID=UPI00221FCD7C|nr:uncharacterized protein GGS23DRAFT_620023 [Durotheca rogersii]KAI5864193.1 hypothetical protein GGS23DRAFT_620023 [Durotheca rogersii]